MTRRIRTTDQARQIRRGLKSALRGEIYTWLTDIHPRHAHAKNMRTFTNLEDHAHLTTTVNHPTLCWPWGPLGPLGPTNTLPSGPTLQLGGALHNNRLTDAETEQIRSRFDAAVKARFAHHPTQKRTDHG